jgi:hypothetical protein
MPGSVLCREGRRAWTNFATIVELMLDIKSVALLFFLEEDSEFSV